MNEIKIDNSASLSDIKEFAYLSSMNECFMSGLFYFMIALYFFMKLTSTPEMILNIIMFLVPAFLFFVSIYSSSDMKKRADKYTMERKKGKISTKKKN